MNLYLLSQERMDNRYYLLASVLSGVILWLAWPPFPLAFLTFVGFVPLFWVADQIMYNDSKHGIRRFTGYVYLGMLIWNLLTTYWIYNATVVGAAFAIIANAFLMTIPWICFYFVFQYSGRRYAYICLIFFWISLEYLHLNWELAWPWLNLGNVFSMFPGVVQWYEYTGALGGTLWVLLMNVLVFQLVVRMSQIKKTAPNWLGVIIYGLPAMLTVLFFLLLPLLLSSWIKNRVELEGDTVRVSVIQPNVDPYSEKFAEGTVMEQINNLLELSRKGAEDGAELIVWPETALPENIRLDRINEYETIRMTREFLNDHPQISLLIGVTSFGIYESPEEKTATARDFVDGSGWYDVFNSALYLDATGNEEVYHKSILVPGVERMPYPQYMGFLERFAFDLGGIAGSMGTQDEASVLARDEQLVMAPVICYESVFGDYVADFVRKGANLIVIITNDGWWGDTEGYKQHFSYASLRAIEMRRSIARSANTGISGFFDALGRPYDETEYWVRDQVTREVILHDELTYYAKHGDFIGRIAAFCSVLLLLLAIVRQRLKKTGHGN